MATVTLTKTPPKISHLATTLQTTGPEGSLPHDFLEEARSVKKEPFDAQKHVAYQPPKHIFSMKDIGLEGQGVSPNAVTEPFKLFSQDAIKQMRAEIFSEDVLDNCQYSSPFVKRTVRGMGPKRAPFTYDAWRSKEVLDKISEVAGIELVPVMDTEISAVNIVVNGSPGAVPPSVDSQVKDEDEVSAFAWHYDSYPFVCVTMLSDCADMIGGETALKTGSGEIMKVRGPAMGTAVVMQGRYINHQALKALGGRERISMITSFRPKSADVKDESVLTGVRGISNLNELYSDYTQYRLELLEDRFREQARQQRQRVVEGKRFDTRDVKEFLRQQKDYIETTLNELVE
ncbi:unnamed protein product [Clonostachys rosea f. rosea IK726]|uniref:Fe2OG dioxygenase domain-containing protein n=2 Tax=Bionectria ochroleuca TaxID=29856 RepID=A0A0B7K8W9_BIOOC|nr:unnamed protein product [Clonostachys rosea f. rosea IK726]